MKRLLALAALLSSSCIGPEGVQGPPGEQGTPGTGAGGIVWRDAAGTTVDGVIANPYGKDGAPTFAVFDGNGLVWGFDVLTGDVSPAVTISTATQRLHYTSADCSTEGFFSVRSLAPPRVVFYDPDIAGNRVLVDAPGASMTYDSYMDPGSGCVPATGTIDGISLAQLGTLPEPTTPSFPATYPLHPER